MNNVVVSSSFSTYELLGSNLPPTTYFLFFLCTALSTISLVTSPLGVEVRAGGLCWAWKGEAAASMWRRARRAVLGVEGRGSGVLLVEGAAREGNFCVDSWREEQASGRENLFF